MVKLPSLLLAVVWLLINTPSVLSVHRRSQPGLVIQPRSTRVRNHPNNAKDCLAAFSFVQRGGSDIVHRKEDEDTPIRRRLAVLLVSIALFNDSLQVSMLAPIIHSLVTSPPPLGVTSNSEVALGIFFASKDLCQFLIAPAAGVWTAQTSPILALCLSSTGLALATLVFARAATFRQLLLARGAQGAASAAVLCGGLSLIAQTHSAEIRGSAIGLAYTGLALGLLSGPLIGGLLFDKFGRKRTFQLAAALVLLNTSAQVLLMWLAPPRRIVHKESTPGSIPATKPRLGLASLYPLLRNTNVLAVTASTLVVHAVLGVIKPISQVILDREFGVSIVQRSWIITIATFTYFISTPIAGQLSDRVPKQNLVATSLAFMAGSCVCFAARTTTAGICAMYACVALLGAALGLSAAAGQALLADLVDRYQLGEYSMAFALSDMADSIGLIIGPVLGLTISQITGSPSVGVGVMGILALLLLPMVLRIPP